MVFSVCEISVSSLKDCSSQTWASREQNTSFLKTVERFRQNTSVNQRWRGGLSSVSLLECWSLLRRSPGDSGAVLICPGQMHVGECQCPGFGQDRVNFHRTPERGTAGGWGLTPPGQTEPGIPYLVTSCWVPVGGGGAAGTHSWLGSVRRWCGPRESGSVFVVFSPYLYRCCYCSFCLLFC